jgi:hypothetical protein
MERNASDAYVEGYRDASCNYGNRNRWFQGSQESEDYERGYRDGMNDKCGEQ